VPRSPQPRRCRISQQLFAHSAGERTVPGIWHETYWYARHEACYGWVQGLLGAADAALVLDAGSGEGFGAARLQGPGRAVVGLDYDAAATAHHARTYPEVPVLRGNLVALPVRSAAVDLLVSLQTIEHVWDQVGFVQECARVLAPGGRLVLSTPNRRTFPPGNVFHHRELDAHELRALIGDALRDVRLVGLAHAPGLAAWEQQHGSIVDRQIATPPPQWDEPLAARVAATTADDFVVTEDVLSCLDLVALAVAP
jgi:SAM-dependent methyltransferase